MRDQFESIKKVIEDSSRSDLRAFRRGEVLTDFVDRCSDLILFLEAEVSDADAECKLGCLQKDLGAMSDLIGILYSGNKDFFSRVNEKSYKIRRG